MRFGLLGPVVVERDGSAGHVKSPMPRTVLAVLLLNANTVVSADQLIEAVWGENPPTTATASLHNHVMRLRRFLGEPGGGRIRSVAPGYVIDVEPGELDLEVFAGLCADGRGAARAGRWAEAARDLTAALALWRGEPVADVPGAVGRDARVLQLVEARLQAREGRVEAELELGRHREVIGELGVLAAEYPLREVFHGQLMLALYRADRQAEALDVFQALRRTLVDELGVEPSASIQELHRQILNADPRLAAPAPAPAPGPAGPIVGPGPAGRAGWRYQLPADTRVFTGRAKELAELTVLAAGAGCAAGTVLISVISGPAGIGKTALAVHAAHRLRERFPDGQLFLDLRGTGADRAPLTPHDALGWLLRSLGVAPSSIPADLAGRAAVFRRRLAETRSLIILDNAAGAEQLRHLLSPAPGSLLLVTSRNPLPSPDGGPAAAGAMELGELPQADAVALLHKVAGPGRVPPCHPSIDELTDLCGNIPLAIRVAAARLRHHRVLRIEDVVAQLRGEPARPAEPGSADRGLAAVFEASHAALPPAEQDLLRRLGLIPGPDIDAFAAANFAGTDHRTAERLLESLLDHNLLTQHTPGRYRFHDSVRLYARTLARGEPPEQCDAAFDRLVRYYLHVGTIAGNLLALQARRLVGDDDPEPWSPYAAPELTDRPSALAWLRTEREDLLAMIAGARSGRTGCRLRSVRLTAALADFLLQEGTWPQAADLHQAAVETARALGDRHAEAGALYDLGRVLLAAGDHPGAAQALETSLALLREVGDRLGQAHAKHQIGRLRLGAGEFGAATSILESALAVFEAEGCAQGAAGVLTTTAEVLAETVGPKQALPVFRRALHAAREAHSLLDEARALAGAARCAAELGDRAAALADLREALMIRRGCTTTSAEAMKVETELAELEREWSSPGATVPGAR